MAELGMDLVRAAHREALRDMQPPPERRTPIPGPPPSYEPAPPPRDDAFGQLFTQVCRCVRQTMLLDERFASGAVRQLPKAANDARAPASPKPPGDATPHPATPHAERLYQERSDERLDGTRSPPAHILAAVGSELSLAGASLAPRAPHEPAPWPRRPIPIIPPGPEPALTAAQRSALRYHQTNAPKPPH